MKNNIFILFIFYFGLQLNIFSQKENDTYPLSLNTCVYDFNEYFYPHGQNVTPNCYYNPNRQFGLFAPQPDTTDMGNSRFNLVNIDYSPCETMPGMQLYYDGPESGPGLYASGSVKLFIKDSTDNSGGTSGDERSRVELCYFPKHFDGNMYTSNVENETYFYRWNFFIPDNESFIDEEVEGGYHIISQFHQVHDHKLEFDPITGNRLLETDIFELNPDDQPPLYINYIHEENAPDNLRNIRFIYGYRTKDPTVVGGMDARASYFGVEDGIKKGEWNTIILKIKWSPYDTIGYLKVWLNNQPVPNDPSQINDPNNPNYNNNDPYKIYGQNMVRSLQGKVVPNYLKIGHYRKYLNSPATIYLDNLIITQNSFVAFQNIEAPFCGKILTNNDMTLSTTPVLGDHQYIFRLENLNDPSDVVWQIDNNPTVYLGNNSNLKSNTTYLVKVKIDGHSTFKEYGDQCEIYTDYLLELIPADCGKTLMSGDMNLSTTMVEGEDNRYVFKLENINDPTNTVWQMDYDPTVYLGNNPDLRSNATYNVSVKIENHPVFGEYGDVCTVYTGNLKGFENKTEKSFESLFLKVYPNPNLSNKTTISSFKIIDSEQRSKIYLLDQKGIVLIEILNKKLNKGVYNQTIDTKGFPTGLYFLILENGEHKTIKKLIIKK